MRLTDMPVQTLVRVAAAEVWRRRRVALGIAWAVSVLGWVAVALLPNTYTSQARVYADTQSVMGPLMKGLAVQPNMDQQLDVMRRTMLSRPNVEQLLRMTDLDLLAHDDNERDRLIQGLQRAINVRMEGKQLFTISYTSRDPVRAQRTVQSLLEIFVEQNVGINRRDIENTRRFIDGQVAEYEQRLRETEGKVAEFRRVNAIDLDNRNSLVNRIQRAEAELQQLQTTLQSTTWRRDQLRIELSRTPAFLNVEQAARGTGGGALADARARLRSLLARTTEQHPDVVALRRQIQAMESGGAGGAGRSTSSRVPNPAHEQIAADERALDLEIDSLRYRIAQAETTVAEGRRLLEIVPEVELKLAQMNRDYDILKRNYDALITRRESALIAQRVEDDTPNIDFRVVEPPVVPLTPSGPPRLILIPAVLALGVAAGLGFVLLRMILRQSFESTKALREAFDLPVLGRVSDTGVVNRAHQAAAIAMAAAASGALLLCFAGLIYLQLIAPASLELAGWLRRALDSLPFLAT
ncbi:MAG TPA: XrtA system polysaccharide chain length determinant [Azospirillum sp.]|nr:XrtA system polysaccharide chain length determinant [Azospirillum sp.]